MRKFLFKTGGKPFFTVGGQFHNCSSYTDEMMERGWDASVKMGFNTVAVPVSWDALEPEEGTFDFSAADRIIEGARSRGLHAVILWFGSWKNGTSHYVPVWVKEQDQRFRRVQDRNGYPIGVLSPFCEETRKADEKAFLALLKHIRDCNDDETVVGIQVENEPGSMGSPRDYSPEAEALFTADVPAEILAFVKTLPAGSPIRQYWEEAGAAESGDWTALFGPVQAAKLFMANGFSSYIDKIAAAGKQVYDITMYINVWLEEMHGRVPGVDFPSGGATCSVLDLWKHNTPHIDAIAPDIYIPDADTHRALCRVYSREDNPFYIPESGPGTMNALDTFRAIAQNGLCGIHIFGIEDCIDDTGALRPNAEEFRHSVEIWKSCAPLLEKDEMEVRSVEQYEGARFGYIDFGDYIGYINFYTVPSNALDYTDYSHRGPEHAGARGKGLIFYAGNGEFYAAGEGYSVVLIAKDSTEHMTSAAVSNYALQTRNLRYAAIEEGRFDENGKFVMHRRRCGDESDYGIWTAYDIGLVHVKVLK